MNPGDVELGDAGLERVGIWLPLGLKLPEVKLWLLGALPPLPGGAVVVTIVVVVEARLLMPPLEMLPLEMLPVPVLELLDPVLIDAVVEI